MGRFTEKDCEACDRCGAFLPRKLAQFHKCRGSDVSKRPANIPLEKWLAAQTQQRNNSTDEIAALAALFGCCCQVEPESCKAHNYFGHYDSGVRTHVRKKRGPSKPPPPPAPPPPREPPQYSAIPLLTLAGVLVLVVLAALLFLRK